MTETEENLFEQWKKGKVDYIGYRTEKGEIILRFIQHKNEGLVL